MLGRLGRRKFRNESMMPLRRRLLLFCQKAQPRVVRNWDEVVIPRDADDVERLTYVPGLVGEATEWMIG
jgi:hypothetical protein